MTWVFIILILAGMAMMIRILMEYQLEANNLKDEMQPNNRIRDFRYGRRTVQTPAGHCAKEGRRSQKPTPGSRQSARQVCISTRQKILNAGQTCFQDIPKKAQGKKTQSPEAQKGFGSQPS